MPGYLVCDMPGYLVCDMLGYLVCDMPGYLVFDMPGYLVCDMPGYLVYNMHVFHMLVDMYVCVCPVMVMICAGVISAIVILKLQFFFLK